MRSMRKSWGEFCEVFGVNPRNRIMEFFLEMKGLDFSIGDVAKETGLNRATTYNTMEELIDAEYLIVTRKVSGGQLYKLNTEKREVLVLIKVFNLLLKNVVEEHQEKEKICV